MQYVEQVPDTVKVAGAIAAPMLTVFGVTVEEWTYILSALVSILFIIEKSPVVWKRICIWYKWMKNVIRNSKE